MYDALRRLSDPVTQTLEERGLESALEARRIQYRTRTGTKAVLDDVTKLLWGEVQKAMGWKRAECTFTNHRRVLIQECEPWMGYEAVHCTVAAKLVHATDPMHSYFIYVPLDDLVPQPPAPQVWVGTHNTARCVSCVCIFPQKTKKVHQVMRGAKPNFVTSHVAGTLPTNLGNMSPLQVYLSVAKFFYLLICLSYTSAQGARFSLESSDEL